MELVASSPPDLLAAADPLARGPAPLLRPAAADDGGNAVALPFERFLELLDTALPGGEALPVDGNGLPVLPCLLPATAGLVTPAAGTSVPTETAAGAAAFERFRLTAALRSVLPPQPLAAGVDAAGSVVTDTSGQSAPVGVSAPVDAAAVGFDLELALDPGRQLPTTAAVPVARAENDIPQQSALAGLVAEVESTAADEARDRARPVAANVRPAATALELQAAVGGGSAPVAASALAPMAEASAGGARSLRRDPAAAPLPLVASASESAASTETDAATTWQLPAAAGTTNAPGAAPTAPPNAQGPAVDTRSPNWHEAFAGRVQWLVDHHVGEARIKLNPPELGAVEVKISLVDDKTYVQLTAGSAAARDELAQSLPRLRELMTASGLQFGGASVHGGDSGHDGRGGYESAGSGAAPFAALEPLVEELQPLRRRGASAGGIDTFA